MIESNIIKRFIVKTFTQHSRAGLGDIAAVVMSAISSRFFVNESVCILPSRWAGKIQHCSRDTYRIALAEGGEVDEAFGNIQRRCSVFYEDVLYFLECITRQTAFGRILIENVNEKIEQKILSGQQKLRSAKGAASKGSGQEAARSTGMPNLGKERADSPDGLTKDMPEPASEDAVRRKVRLDAAATGGMQDLEKRYRESAGQQHPVDSEEAKTPAERPQEQLDVANLQRLIIPGYEGESFKRLMKVYMLLSNFWGDFGLDEFSLESLGEALKEPDYASKLAFSIHNVLIGMVDAEMKARKERYYESITFIIENLPSFVSDSSASAAKRRITMTPENWKMQTKLFIHNLCKDVEDDRILQFLGFSRKDAFALRLKFLAFLVDITVLTERFRDLVTANQADYRAAKARHDELVVLCKKKAGGEQPKIEELEACNRAMAVHPLRVHLGSYQAYTAFVMDGKPLLKDNNEFYRLGKKDISLIICNLKVASKSDKNLASNLKTCAEALL